jgi:hypothetical protein
MGACGSPKCVLNHSSWPLCRNADNLPDKLLVSFFVV